MGQNDAIDPDLSGITTVPVVTIFNSARRAAARRVALECVKSVTVVRSTPTVLNKIADDPSAAADFHNIIGTMPAAAGSFARGCQFRENREVFTSGTGHPIYTCSLGKIRCPAIWRLFLSGCSAAWSHRRAHTRS
jgi:hypothetical protein